MATGVIFYNLCMTYVLMKLMEQIHAKNSWNTITLNIKMGDEHDGV